MNERSAEICQQFDGSKGNCAKRKGVKNVAVSLKRIERFGRNICALRAGVLNFFAESIGNECKPHKTWNILLSKSLLNKMHQERIKLNQAGSKRENTIKRLISIS